MVIHLALAKKLLFTRLVFVHTQKVLCVNYNLFDLFLYIISSI